MTLETLLSALALLLVIEGLMPLLGPQQWRLSLAFAQNPDDPVVTEGYAKMFATTDAAERKKIWQGIEKYFICNLVGRDETADACDFGHTGRFGQLVPDKPVLDGA